MEFKAFEVGQPVCSPCMEGVTFNLTSGGAVLKAAFNHPSANEKRAFKNGVPQFKLAEVDGVIFFLSRFGTLSWMDSPYYRRLSQYELQRPAEGYGLSLHVMLIDSSTGVLVTQRMIGLNTKFTNDLLTMVYEQPDLGDQIAYEDHRIAVMRQYPTTELVKMAVATN